MRVPALVVSYVLHPLWTPLLVLFLLWWVDPWLRLQPAVMFYVGSVFLINALAPAVSIYVLHRRGVLGDLEVSERSERLWPFLIVLFYQALGLFALTRPGVYLPREVLALVVAMMASLVLALFVNRRFKMSMHMLANGGAFGAVSSTRLAFPRVVAPPSAGRFFRSNAACAAAAAAASASTLRL